MDRRLDNKLLHYFRVPIQRNWRLFNAVVSALIMLQAMVEAGRIDHASVLYHTIFQAFESVANAAIIDCALEIVQAQINFKKAGFHWAIPRAANWTQKALAVAGSMAKAAINKEQHTLQIDTAVTMLDNFKDTLDLGNNDLDFMLLGSFMTSMWAWTHPNRLAGDIPGYDFGMVVYRDIVGNKFGRPEIKIDGQFLEADFDEPVTQMPGSNWGSFFYKDERITFFHTRKDAEIFFTITHLGKQLHSGLHEHHARFNHILRERDEVQTIADEERKSAMTSISKASKMPFPINEAPKSVDSLTVDIDDWQGVPAMQWNIAIQDINGAFTNEFLSQVVGKLTRGEMPFAFIPTTQTHTTFVYNTMK